MLFTKYSEKERALLELYTQLFFKAGIKDPSKVAENLLEEAIKEAKKIQLPKNAGDKILEKEKRN